MSASHCALSYHQMAIAKLPTFATGVKNGQFNNPVQFPVNPVDQPTFEKHISNYEVSYKAYKKGGENQKGQFLIDKAALISDLDAFAISTDVAAAGDADIVILGGFVPTDGTNTKSVIPETPITTLTRGAATGVLLAEANVVAGAKNYGCILSLKPFSTATVIDKTGQLTLGPNDFFAKMDLTKSRKKQFVGLTAGTIYYVYFYASNTAGVSQLSKVESIMCA